MPRRQRHVRLALCAALVTCSLPATGLVAGAAAAQTRTTALGRHLLASVDLPDGWKKVAAPKSDATTKLGCIGQLAHPGKGWHHDEAAFVNGKGLPFVAETLATGPRAARIWQGARATLSDCHSATITVNGKRDHATIGALPFTAQATGTIASRWQLRATGLQLGIDVFFFRIHQTIGSISYTDAGTPDTGNAEDFADAAIAKGDGGSGAVKGVVTVATAPIRVVRTSDGAVAYRLVGSGPPLVLVMGYGGSMEVWDPQFIDALAHRFTVVIFDSAGIGKTSPLPAPLTIDAMAQQTSALIAALRLGAPDVLGWSMGGLVAEALAVLHPEQVHQLVLCATFPGTGAVRSPQSVVDELNAGGSKALSALFPPGHEATATVYTVADSMYLEASSAPAHVVKAQGDAVLEAWAGADAGLRGFRGITAPTLVADGALDRLVPAENARALVAGIAGSRLLVYKGAGHAFLFQDLGTFVPALESFLSG